MTKKSSNKLGQAVIIALNVALFVPLLYGLYKGATTPREPVEYSIIIPVYDTIPYNGDTPWVIPDSVIKIKDEWFCGESCKHYWAYIPISDTVVLNRFIRDTMISKNAYQLQSGLEVILDRLTGDTIILVQKYAKRYR